MVQETKAPELLKPLRKLVPHERIALEQATWTAVQYFHEFGCKWYWMEPGQYPTYEQVRDSFLDLLARAEESKSESDGSGTGSLFAFRNEDGEAEFRIEFV